MEGDGFSFGGILDKTLDLYGQVSIARAERDTAKYEAAGAKQAAELHASQAYSSTEAYATGNAVNPARASNTIGGYIDRIPKPLFWGSVALLGGAVVLKAVS